MRRSSVTFVRSPSAVDGRGERGFGLVEVVVSVGILMVVMVMLMRLLTTGLLDIGLARQRQGASGLANEVVEQIRGLAYNRLDAGIDRAELDPATDPLVKPCGSQYKLDTCDGDDNFIVNTPLGSAPTDALKPYRVTVPVGPTTYDRRVYVTRDLDGGPYTVTVVVSWPGRLRASAADFVRTETVLFSPDGCLGTDTHPYAAPCESFLLGDATVPQARAELTGTVDRLSFTRAAVFAAASESETQKEQISRVTGQARFGRLEIDGTVAGDAPVSTAADNDQSPTTPGEYSTGLQPALAQSLDVSAGGASLNRLRLSLAAGSAGRTTSTVAAGGANVCASETDGLACGESEGSTVGHSSATLTLATSAGTMAATVVDIVGSGVDPFAVSRTDRESEGDEVDAVRASAQRRLTLRLGEQSAPLGTPGWLGWFLELADVDERVASTVGKGASSGTASVTGRIRYWNGSGYTELPPLGEVTAPVAVGPTQLDLGSGVVATFEGSARAGGTTEASECVPDCSSPTRVERSARTSPPLVGTFTYRVIDNGTTLASLTVQVDLGGISTRGIYVPAPEPAPTPTPQP